MRSAAARHPPAPAVLPPPGAIPVQVVTNPEGKQVIVIEQNQPKNIPSLGTVSISSICKNVCEKLAPRTRPAPPTAQVMPARSVMGTKAQQMHARVNSGGGSSADSRSRRPAPVGGRSAPVPLGSKHIWEAPIDHNNVAKVLERSCSITDSLKLVMDTLRNELKRSSNYPPVIAIEKRKLVAVKLRTAVGAFKKQILDIETYTLASRNKATAAASSSRMRHSPPSTVKPGSIVASRKAAKKPVKSGEVIMLSDSSDDEDKKKKKTPTKKSSRENSFYFGQL